MKEGCWKLHGNLYAEITFKIKIKTKLFCLFRLRLAKPEMVNGFHPNHTQPNPPMGGQANIDPPSSPPIFLLFLYFFSISTQPRQMRINRKSRKWLENKLVVKSSRLNFYFKRNFWNRGRWAQQLEELWSLGLRLSFTSNPAMREKRQSSHSFE